MAWNTSNRRARLPKSWAAWSAAETSDAPLDRAPVRLSPLPRLRARRGQVP